MSEGSRAGLPPRAEDTWDDDTREVLDRLATGGTVGAGKLLNIFATLAHHPKALKRWVVFGNHVLSKSTLPARDRELLILRTGWRCRSPYEWGQHVVIGRAVGLTDDEIARVAEGPEAAGWDPFEVALLRAADELRDDVCLSDDTWRALAKRYSDQQMIDVLFCVGQYHVVAMALNSLRVERDDGLDADSADIPFPRR